MTEPRLLVYTPTYGGLLRQETVGAVKAQEFGGSLTHIVSEHNPHPGRDMRNVLWQYQRARQLMIDSGYDGLLTVEHDMLPPTHAAQTLWDTEAAVAYGIYPLRHGAYVLNAWRYENDVNLGMSLSMHQDDLDRAKQLKAVRVSGVGFGCTLIRRHVLEEIEFRSGENSGPDLPFALDCLHKGLPAFARFDVSCGHYQDGEWLTMENHGAPVARVVALANMAVNIGGTSVRLEMGTEYDIPTQDALDLQRAAYVRIISGARETATAEERETATAPAAQRRSKRAA